MEEEPLTRRQEAVFGHLKNAGLPDEQAEQIARGRPTKVNAGHQFWCSAPGHAHPADVLVKSAGTQNVTYPTCYDAVAQVIRARLAEDDRAAIQVRNARTWHAPRG